MRIELDVLDRKGNGPLYRELKEVIRGAILSGVYKPGQRMESQAEFMKHAKLSTRTVSRAFKELVDEGWVVRNKGVGTFVSERTRPAATQLTTVAVVFKNFANEMVARILGGFELECQKQGYVCQLVSAGHEDDSEDRAVSELRAGRIAGIVTQPDAQSTRHGELIRVIREQVPVVLVNDPLPGVDSDLAVADNEEASYQLTRHLLELGHTRMAFISSSFKYPYGPSIADRIAGMRRALHEWGENADDDDVAVLANGDREQDVRQAVTDVIERPAHRRPTAIVCLHDHLARRVVCRLQGLGIRVPEDISVATFDDLSFATNDTPRLTTVRTPCKRIGKKAASLLFDRLSDPAKPPVVHYFDAPIIVRESTAPPP